MRVRRFELRLIAAALTLAWGLAAALVLLGYRPGGPLDLAVGIAACLPIGVGAAALRWPPVARGDRAFASIVWLGLSATIVLVPTLSGLVTALRAGGPQTLVPSAEAAYPFLLALTGTAAFAGLGIAREVLGETSLRRPRLALGLAIAAGLTAVGGAPFTAAAAVNELALRDRPAATSRFGPTDPDITPPACDGALFAPRTARVALALSAEVDRRSIGSLDLRGVRAGDDLQWEADVATARALGRFEGALVDGTAWERGPRLGWATADAARAARGDDRLVLAGALAAGNRLTAEDRGLAFVEGARARACRTAVDGPTFRSTFPAIDWLVGEADLSRWRGQLDYWVFTDSGVGQVSGSLNGEAFVLEPVGIQGLIAVRLTITERGAAATVTSPLP